MTTLIYLVPSLIMAGPINVLYNTVWLEFQDAEWMGGYMSYRFKQSLKNCA